MSAVQRLAASLKKFNPSISSGINNVTIGDGINQVKITQTPTTKTTFKASR